MGGRAGGSYVELILPSGEIPMTAHSSKPIMVVPQPNIWCTDQCQKWKQGRATKWDWKALMVPVAL